jgi:hypothetical protein
LEKKPYRKWSDCYLISNGSTKVVINASAGGRIMVYERGGINIIYEDPEQDGLLLSDYRNQMFDPDGGRFDYGQEQLTKNIHALTYMGPWSSQILNEFSLQITSLPDPDLGIQSTRVFTLDPDSSRLHVTQIMKNITDKPTEYFFWGRTLVKSGGVFFMPLNPNSQYPDQWGRYIWGDPEIFESDPKDPGVSITGNIFSILPEKAINEKYGNDSQSGWMAYAYKSLLFVRKNKYFPGAKYTEHYGQTNIFYTNKLFAEMEPISPCAFLKPGEEYLYEEDWNILEYTSGSETPLNVLKATEFLQSQIKENDNKRLSFKK